MDDIFYWNWHLFSNWCIEPQYGFWEISDNFKEVIRNELVQYIVKAFDLVFGIYAKEEDCKKASMEIPKLKQLANSTTSALLF